MAERPLLFRAPEADLGDEGELIDLGSLVDWEASQDAVRSAQSALQATALQRRTEFKTKETENPPSDDSEDDGSDEEGRRKKRTRSMQDMTQEQRSERRDRNREHAKRSRLRKRFLVETLQQSIRAVEAENDKLRSAVREHLGPGAEPLLAACGTSAQSVLASDARGATRELDDPDFSLVKALQTAEQNFVISDPSLPDNPIVYASEGFLALTGYSMPEVLGRNCRFLQGPETDPNTVAALRAGLARGEDTAVVLLNYRKDGTPFWNQLFVAPLRDGASRTMNYLGVQCRVSEAYAQAAAKNAQGAR